jgi:hypothetical protein
LRPAEVVARFDLLGLVSAGLLAVAVTLAALVPAFIEIARGRVSDFLTGQERRRRIVLALNMLTGAMVILAVVVAMAIVAFLIPSPIYLFVAMGCFGVGLVLLTGAGLIVAAALISTV